MQIQKLKPSRIKNRINVVFDDNSYLPLFIDDVVKNNLKIGSIVDFKEIKTLSTNYLAREYALRQIAISPKTQTILRRKLRQKYPDFDSENLLLDLDKYLDEKQFVEYFLRKYKKKSNREIQYRLKMAGVNYKPAQNEQEKISILLQKKKNLTISSLIQRGFAYDDIKSVFAKLGKIK